MIPVLSLAPIAAVGLVWALIGVWRFVVFVRALAEVRVYES